MRLNAVGLIVALALAILDSMVEGRRDSSIHETVTICPSGSTKCPEK